MTFNTQQLLTWPRVHEWAEQQEPGAIVGESCTNSTCPLANYLRDQTGIHWSVGPSIRPVDGTVQDRLNKPKWVQMMIDRTDEATGNKGGHVTREQLLAVLEQVKNEAEPYTPSPSDEGLFLTLLTGQVCQKIQSEYSAGRIADLDTYNCLSEMARKADMQARKLLQLLEGGQQREEK